ncbi:MAG TPA: chemotaxis protein CheA [Bacillota bacterium]
MNNNTPGQLDQNIISTYIAETKEQIERLVFILLQIEEHLDRQNAFIDEMFRLAHNIKGSSGLVGLNEVKETMHELESFFDLVRKGQYRLDESDVDLLLAISDELTSFFEGNIFSASIPWEMWIEKIKMQAKKGKTDDAGSVKESKKELPLQLSDVEKKQVAEWQEAGKEVYGIELYFTDEAPMRSATALIFIKYLKQYGEVFKIVPDYNELEKEEYNSIRVVVFCEKALTPEEEARIINYPVNDGVKEVTIRKWQYRKAEGTNVYGEKTNWTQTVRIEAERIDKVINQLGSILTLRSSLLHLHQEGYQGKRSWEEFGKLLRNLDQGISALQLSTMELRMIPVRQIFARFPKIVRDVAKKCGKKIELHLIGEETEIDKQVAEELVDPLTHLVRNSIDHGIEDAEEREKYGKGPVGQVTLDARQVGGHLVVSVRDDGRGLNLEKIKNKAVKAGIIKADSSLSKEELYKLIFAPGFSTADQVSDISGRGVGLDVVQNSLKKLHGDIEVKSVQHVGTEFILKVPLTLAIIQAFMVKIGGQVFGIPAIDVVLSKIIKESEIHLVGDRMIYYNYPQTIPLIDLGSRFMFMYMRNKDLIPIVIVNYGQGRVGYIVEELLGLEEIMIKPINKSIGEIPEIAGAALLGNGNIALILNNQAIAQEAISL